MHIPRPADLEQGRNPVDTGAMVLGDKGTIMYGSHGAGGVRIIPESKMKAYKLPPKSIPPCKSTTRTGSSPSAAAAKPGPISPTAAALSEIGMLGVIAGRFAGTKLQWDADAMKFTNCAEANALVAPEYRAGWSL